MKLLEKQLSSSTGKTKMPHCIQQALLTTEGKGAFRQTWCRAGCQLAQPAPHQPLDEAAGQRTASSEEWLWEKWSRTASSSELPAWLTGDSHSKGQLALLSGSSLWFCIGKWSHICYKELCYLFCCKNRILSDRGFCVFSFSSSYTSSFSSPKQIQF